MLNVATSLLTVAFRTLTKGTTEPEMSYPHVLLLLSSKKRPAGSPSPAAFRGNRANRRITQPNSIPLPHRSALETRDYFCLVCGDKNHIWTQCPSKQHRGCAACGSDAHLVRNCAQRWTGATAEPHRWDQLPEAEKKKPQEWSLASNNSAEP